MLEEIVEIVKFHKRESEYWREEFGRRKIKNSDIEGISSVEDLFHLLGPQPEDVLREYPQKVQPHREKVKRVGGRLVLSRSSGSTGIRKEVWWCEDSNIKFKEYTSMFFDWMRKEGRMKVEGPFISIYTSDLMYEHMKHVANTLGVEFIGVQLDSYKTKYYLEAENYDAVNLKLESVIDALKSAEKWKPQIALIAPLPQLLEALPSSVEYLILGGLNLDEKVLEKLQNEYKLIGEFGHFALGASWGYWKVHGLNTYYSNYPWITFLIVDENNEVVDYNEEGDLAYVRIGWDLLWIGKEGDKATRVPPKEPFEWDGIRSPHRKIKELRK